MSSSMENDNQRLSEFQQDFEVLQEIAFFSNYPAQALKIMGYLCSRGSFEPGEIVLEQGEDAGQAFYILSGSMVAERDGLDSEKAPVFTAGDFVCSLSLLGPLPMLFNLKTVEATKVLAVNRDQFQKVLDEFPEINRIALKTMLTELYHWENKCLDAGVDSEFSKIGVSLI